MSAASARQGQRYRRRRPLPALILLAVLIVLSGFVWTRVFESTETVEMATRCNVPTSKQQGAAGSTPQPPEPPAKTVVGTMMPRDALNDVVPVPPQDVRVRVLNANGQVNQATLISKELSNLGFGHGGEPANDPIYRNQDLNCHAQIRYGAAGSSAARTLSLIAPCAQLVRDERTDPTVDLALGKEFSGIKTTQQAHQLLQKLKTWGKQHDPVVGDQKQVRPPKLDEDLLSKARDVHC